MRVDEAREATWDEINWKDKILEIPGERMKVKDGSPHFVPLSKQVLEILEELKKLNLSKEYIFALWNSLQPISENTWLYALYRMGYHHKQTCHGFRSLASTILNTEFQKGKHPYHGDIIEKQLAHLERNASRRAYNHAQYLAQRIPMMQWYSDYLDQLVLH